MRTLNTTTLDNMGSFIIDYQKRKGKSPSFREVMKALNMSSLNLVRTYILALENSGRIERTRLGNIDMLPKLKPSGMAIAPIVGTKNQAEDLINYIKDNAKDNPDGIWDTNIFGKTIEQIVNDGIYEKTHNITKDNIDEIIRLEIGKVFVQVLECAGVYKTDDNGREAFVRFIKYCQ